MKNILDILFTIISVIFTLLIMLFAMRLTIINPVFVNLHDLTIYLILIVTYFSLQLLYINKTKFNKFNLVYIILLLCFWTLYIKSSLKTDPSVIRHYDAICWIAILLALLSYTLLNYKKIQNTKN